MQLEQSTELLALGATTLKMLAVDGVQKANSGHPGMPMGTADMAMVLWRNFLRFDPKEPSWINRDRFVLSAGHGSMLLYSLLHLFGYQVTIDDLKSFRQWESRTPGHPERGCLPGVECTTGPLGQGFGMGVGMALAGKILAAQFNTEEIPLIDHKVYAIVSDGDLMEGVAAEAASLAGHLKLDNLVYLYDSNRITIEGSTELAYSDNVAGRFESYGWKVYSIDGHNYNEILDALAWAASDTTAPKLIIARTHIAKGSPNLQDHAESHGSPLGAEEVKLTRQNIGWPEEPTFYVPTEVKDYCDERVKELQAYHQRWNDKYSKWRDHNPELAQKWDIYMEKKIPVDLPSRLLEDLPQNDEATRVSSGKTIQKLAAGLPFILGGCADLEPSIKCHIKAASSIAPGDFRGKNIHFGIREHGMGAILNGMALHGALVPYGGTFLIFSDYMKPSIRLSSIMGTQVIYIFTHDSVFLGEDGPTHQPIEQLGTLRLIPNLHVFRPADAMETAMAWFSAVKRKDGPTALILSRQNVPQLERDADFDATTILRGGYILEDSKNMPPDLVIIATGSEVHLAQKTKRLLEAEGFDSRLVSVPSLEVFMEQEEEYRVKVIPRVVARMVVIEASNSRDWDRFLGNYGLFIGINHFGNSAPAKVIAEHYGFTPEKLKATLMRWLEKG
jgi:transketolase